MNKTDREIIDKLTQLIADLLSAVSQHPTSARRYTRTRIKVEQALRMIGSGYRRELQRPKTIGLPKMELKKEDMPAPREPITDVLADNLQDVPEEKPKPKRKPRKKKNQQ